MSYGDPVDDEGRLGLPWSPDVGGGPLWARTWRVAVSTYPGPDVLRLMVEEVGPQVARQAGFRGATVLVDQASGDLLTATFWDSPEHLEASASRAGNASVAWQALGEGGGPRELRVCDVLAVLPSPTVADPDLLPPGVADRAPRTDRVAGSGHVPWHPGVGGGPLWARSWRLAVPAYPAEDAQQLVVEEVVPRIAALPGFRGGHLLVDQADGSVLTTTFWDSPADLERSAAAASQAGAAAEVLSEGGSVQDVRVCDVLSLLPTPTTSHPHLRPPGQVG